MKNKGLSYAYWTVVIVMLAVGAVGWYWRVTAGHQMANYGELIVWGLWIAMYIYFIGLSAGSFLIASLSYVFGVERFRPIARLALFTALISLMVGLLHTWFDLGHMGRFLELYTRPSFSSMMSVMVWMYTIYAILVVVMFWYETRQDFIHWSKKPGLAGSLSKLLAFGGKDVSAESREKDTKIVKVLGVIGVLLTLTFGGGEGALFAVVAARPSWHSGLLPILFLVSALASSAGLFLMIYAFVAPNRGTQTHRSLVSDLGLLTLGLVLLDVLFTFAEYSIALYGAVPNDIAPLLNIMTGPFWYVFWIGQVGLGMVIPIIILSTKSARNNSFWAGVAGLSVIIAFVAVRLNIVIPPLALPELQGLIDAVPSPRMATIYVPSTMEWFLTIGLVGLGLALFALGYSLLPIKPETKEA